MKKDFTKLSAYLDGELTADEVSEIRSLLEADTDFAAELEVLKTGDIAAKSGFDDMLDEPMSPDLVALAAQIQTADLAPSIPVAANSNFRWQSIAAAAVFLMVGGIGGYIVNDQTTPDIQIASSGNWLSQVASYHGIYAREKRHLVEVDASESDHIKKWLGNTTNIGFSIPDLSTHGFEFRGARLLVVKAQPVAQLMFTDDQGAVIAICFKQGASGAMGSDSFDENEINDFNIVSWNERSANFLVIGEVKQNKLKDIAETVKFNI